MKNPRRSSFKLPGIVLFSRLNYPATLIEACSRPGLSLNIPLLIGVQNWRIPYFRTYEVTPIRNDYALTLIL